MRKQVRLCAEFLLLVPFRQRYGKGTAKVFVFRHLDIKAVKKAVARYKQIGWAKINFDKNEG